MDIEKWVSQLTNETKFKDPWISLSVTYNDSHKHTSTVINYAERGLYYDEDARDVICKAKKVINGEITAIFLNNHLWQYKYCDFSCNDKNNKDKMGFSDINNFFKYLESQMVTV